MAQQHTHGNHLLATTSEKGHRTDYLKRVDRHGFTWNRAQIGNRQTEFGVIVFHQPIATEADVTLSISLGGFDFQEALSIQGARLLAKALNAAADQAEALENQRDEVAA